MSKLTYEDKINIYQERKQGNTLDSISKKYGVRKDLIKYLIRLIDKHGYDILRTNKNRKFTIYEKEQIINRVLINNEAEYIEQQLGKMRPIVIGLRDATLVEIGITPTQSRKRLNDKIDDIVDDKTSSKVKRLIRKLVPTRNIENKIMN